MSDGPQPFRRQPFADWRARMAAGRSGGMRSLFGLIALLFLMLVLVVVALPYLSGGDTWIQSQRAAQAREKPEGVVIPTQDPETRKAQAEARKQELAKLYDGALVDVDNGQDFVESDGYRKLVKHFVDHRESAAAPEQIPYLDWERAAKEPASLQGQYVRARGIATVRRWKLDRPVWELIDVWRVFLRDPDGSNRMVIDLVERPPQFAEERDPVEVEGVFYRSVSFAPATRPDERVTIPYLIGKTLRVIEQKPTGIPGFLADWGIYAVLFVLALAWALYRIVRLVRGGRDISTPDLHKTDFRKIFDDKLRAAGRGPTASPPS